MTPRQMAQWRRAHGEPDLPLPAVRKKPDNEESRIQAGVICWWHFACKRFGIPEAMLFAVGNGGLRSPVTGAIMKREGVRRGTSDLLLLAMRGRYGALAIEMKKPTGTLSKEQQEFLTAATNQGYAAFCCYSYDEAIQTIERYLTTPEELF